MPALRMLSGDDPGRIINLTGRRTVLGRYPDCGVILENTSISRHHAQILSISGQYYLEDLRSRNGTYLNGELVQGRVELNDRDKIRICDVHLRFLLNHLVEEGTKDSELFLAKIVRGTISEENDHPVGTMDDSSNPPGKIDGNSEIIQTIEPSSTKVQNFGVDPELRLKTMLTISEAIGTTLVLDQLLPRILDSLFDIFPQANNGFFLLRDERNRSGKSQLELSVKAEKFRSIEDSVGVSHSSTIIDRAIKSGESILSANIQDDTRFRTSESIPEMSIRSMMCVPLLTKASETLGVLQLDTKDFSREFNTDDLELLASVASQVSMSVENARLHEEILDQRDTERDLELATQIQLDFLPQKRPQLDHYEFYDHYEAAKSVGGDYFDYIPLPNGKIVIAQGDVSGKGVSAALLMARLYASVRYRFLAEPTPAQAVQKLNKDVIAGGLGFRFITFVAIVLDPISHECQIVCAGHLPPLFRKNNDGIQYMDINKAGVPLGVTPNAQYEEITLQLEQGESVILYTDGVTEMMDSKMVLFGRKKLKEIVQNLPHETDAIIQGIVDAVEDYGGNRSPRDDMCLVGFRRLT